MLTTKNSHFFVCSNLFKATRMSCDDYFKLDMKTQKIESGNSELDYEKKLNEETNELKKFS